MGCLDEHIHLCRIDAICSSRSVGHRGRIFTGYFDDLDGEYPTCLLRDFHVGEISESWSKETLHDFFPDGRNVFFALHSRATEKCGPQLVFLFIALFNQLYWIVGSVVGGLLGSSFSFNTQGIDFAMTALFVVIFVNQWREAKSHVPALVGLVCSLVCLLLFGADNFILPALIGMVVLLSVFRGRLDRPEEGAAT